MNCRPSCGNDPKVCGPFAIHYHQNITAGATEKYESLLFWIAIRIQSLYCERVIKHTAGKIEADTMFLQVGNRFRLVPFEMKTLHIVRPARSGVNVGCVCNRPRDLSESRAVWLFLQAAHAFRRVFDVFIEPAELFPEDVFDGFLCSVAVGFAGEEDEADGGSVAS